MRRLRQEKLRDALSSVSWERLEHFIEDTGPQLTVATASANVKLFKLFSPNGMDRSRAAVN